ncbi:hypothetical protein BDV06DRAFT_230509 [Aspergillus oleicola]
MAKLEPYVGNYYLWEYVPSIAASIIFLLLFLAATVFHCWKAWKTNARFCIAFCLGGLFQVIGYAGRAVCTNQTNKLGPYVIQSIFILLAPVLYAASIYMFLKRLMRAVDAEKYSLIRARWLTKTFVTGDIFSFLVQGTGGGMMAMEGMADTAKGIVIGGLMIQIVVFGFFMVTSVVFEVRMHRGPTAREESWRENLYPLYAVSVLIMIRSIFRVIEYAGGQKGYLLSHEWTLFVFDSVLMLGVMVIWGIWHPGTTREEVVGEQLLSMGSSQNKV